MRPYRTALVAGAALAACLAASGCTTPCQELGDRICNCLPVGSSRNTCQTDVKNRVNTAHPTSDENSYCSALLNTCPDPGTNWDPSSPPPACALLQTCQGMINCGLAYPAVTGLVLPATTTSCTFVTSPLPDGGP
ncbi:MAG TPA: hypothetical protein VMT17_15265 [Anaeromyxobacteraceae bacterium]|nr:hypothetical protein [Anaeromyxobacteraceae bacterium]